METTTAKRVIHKHVLWPNPDGYLISLGAPKILSVGVQRDQVCVWVEVNPDAKMTGVRFWAIPTGNEIPTSFSNRFPVTFLGTVMLDGGALVFHIYYRIEP